MKRLVLTILLLLATAAFSQERAPAPKFKETAPVPKFSEESGKKRAVFDEISVLMVSAPWCGPCHAMLPMLDRVRARGTKVTVVDGTDPAVQPWVQKYGINQYPTMYAYRGHEAVEQTVGALSESELIAWVARVRAGGQPSGRFLRCRVQAEALGQEGREVLRWVLSAPSCGMAWCMVHRGWVQERVREQPATTTPQQSAPVYVRPGGG